MRIVLGLIVLVLIAAGGYAAYWFYAAGQIEGQTRAWVAEREAEGWDISDTAISVGGFPGAHTIVLADLQVAATPADGGWSMAAEEMRVQAAAPWNFESWTLYPGPSLSIQPADGGPVRLAADASSLTLDTDNGAVTGFYAEAQNVAFQAGAPALDGAEALFAQGERTGDGVWRVQFEGRGAILAEDAMADARSAFGGRIDLLALDLQAGEAGLAALAAGLANLPEAGDLTINAARLEWGAARLSGQGALGVTQDGRLRGDFDVAVEDAAGFLGALTGASIIPAGVANVALAASAFFPRDEAGRAIMSFAFEDGETKLGPVSVGPSPQVFQPEG